MHIGMCINTHTHTRSENPRPCGHINTSECNPVNRVSQMTKLIREILSGSSLCTALMCAHNQKHTHARAHRCTYRGGISVEHWSD